MHIFPSLREIWSNSLKKKTNCDNDFESIITLVIKLNMLFSVNIVTSLFPSATLTYIHKTETNISSDPKALWKYTRSRRSTCNELLSVMNRNNVSASTGEAVADLFATHFSETFTMALTIFWRAKRAYHFVLLHTSLGLSKGRYCLMRSKKALSWQGD